MGKRNRVLLDTPILDKRWRFARELNAKETVAGDNGEIGHFGTQKP